jgi:predicted membrane protein
MADWDDNSDAARRRVFRREAQRRHGHGRHGIFFGALICAVGVILLLDHLGYVSADHLWRFWPLIIVIVGVANLTDATQRAWGLLLVVVGGLFLLSSLDIIRLHWGDIWPIAIIAAGALMIWNSVYSRRVRVASDTTTGADSGNTMNAAAVFGAVERRVTAHDFAGGTVSAIFGGVELDFRNADIQGDQAVLEINAIFGGAELRVPENWRVELRGQTIFGGYSDTTRDAVAPGAEPTKRKLLILTGSTIFGGVEIKN